jgi:subtilase family serine protease
MKRSLLVIFALAAAYTALAETNQRRSPAGEPAGQLQELLTPSSLNFHKFLTPEEWNARFAPSVADEQAVLDWATSERLAITHRYLNRLIVAVEAPVATIERSLRVTINTYAFQNYSFFSNDREPAIPTHLAGIVHSIGGLTTCPKCTSPLIRAFFPGGHALNNFQISQLTIDPFAPRRESWRFKPTAKRQGGGQVGLLKNHRPNCQA